MMHVLAKPTDSVLIPVYGKAGIVAHTMIEAADLKIVDGLRWNLSLNGSVRCTTTKLGVRIRLHQLLLGRVKGMDIDHVNRNPLDNRRSNLRRCRRIENSANQIGRNTESGVRGVRRRSSGKWMAYIKHNYENIYLGQFDTKELAGAARRSAELKMRGEFAPQVAI